ncbi:MAG: uroporphyrinogen decarboxylase family protein [Anaerolineae bacterium]|nr:uroporphyrinogen decarboxylase family protein [Anaerolineae bacterium]
MTAKEFIPIELVFNPNWWYNTAGISFDESFYFNPEARMRNDVIMRRVLYERYGELGLGEPDPRPRPIIGSLHVAGGFVIPALLGAEIRFEPNAAPQPLPKRLTPQEIEALEKPDFRTTWPMNELIVQMDTLEAEWGYPSASSGQALVGDLNTDGLLNAAYHFYGQDLFLDFYLAPERVRRFLELIGELIVDVALYVRERTGSCSISVNRMVERVDGGLFLHANCSVQMISPRDYREMHLPVEQRMAERIQPFGVHHCGDNMHLIAPAYAELPAVFFDVGWGSDVARCREALPEAFFNLRLSPIRMLQCTPQEVAEDTERLLLAAGPLEQAGVCCINMDYGTPDDNIFAMFEVVQRYRRYGA